MPQQFAEEGFRWLVYFQSEWNGFHRFFCAPPVGHECFFYLPTSLLSISNMARLFGYGFFLWIGLGLALATRDRWSRWISNRSVSAITLGLALLPWFVFLKIEGLRIRLAPVLLVCAGLLWFLLLATLRGQGRFRFVPWVLVLALLGLGMVKQEGLLRNAQPLERMPVSVLNPQEVLRSKEGWWYADTLATTAGLWRYDPASGRQTPWFRAYPLMSFRQKDGFLFLCDEFEGRLLKVEALTRKKIWAAPIPPGLGPYRLEVTDDSIVALGEAGYAAVFDLEGRKRAERLFGFPLPHPQWLGQGRVASVAKDRLFLRISRIDPPSDEEIPFPLPPRWISLRFRGSDRDRIPLVTDTAYAPSLRVLVLSALWGEIFRYDSAQGRWLPTFRVGAGVHRVSVDDSHGLLFTYNHARGAIGIYDLNSGKRSGWVIAPVFGERLSLSPSTQEAILSVHGPTSVSVPKPGGLYRFSYQPFLRQEDVP